ncbi:N-acetylglucosamine-6-phosphate deacetylase [Cellulosilyticum sp. ST5]|uniref:N-acetylglucosamine-6-phosphate deacetylase n=1 Tax=unclassified Cellulosilyticum TaxID=2643091 RepID=UPI000F8DE6EF|nr:N-acetylglucosamine-6-phosphate deacetylase [Cellulosilyticum sp. WCF-2]QEH70459.1 N-acetylglucosamine-6-phosphate deacetylase [Cellulosilyticum sp. WCF-2]
MSNNCLSGKIFTEDGTFQEGVVTIENERITRLEKKQDVPDYYILPGLVDVHFHGCAGHDFCEGTKEAMIAIAEYEERHGITSICPATMTLAAEVLLNICEQAASVKKEIPSLVGINLEGPFLSYRKKGAQNGTYLQKPDINFLYELQKKAQGLIKLVAIAPEIEGAMACIEKCKNDFHFSIAHTEADYEETSLALKAGADHVTHLFNAMPVFGHRTPSVVGAAFDNEKTYVEVIGDGVHIHSSMIRSIFKLFGENRVVLISDSMMATGMQDGMYLLGGQDVIVKGNLATLVDGTIAGSATNLYDCMVNVISMGISPKMAIEAATINPAKSIGLDKEIGSIQVGKYADLLIVDKNYKLIKVVSKGKIIDLE